ncbi:AmmeMemoRadiSam system protein B [Candidatus Poribacteria bacterium]|nr:AmmeMemoRadiSam system protein B [Candidatus Poribacteria bacterium]
MSKNLTPFLIILMILLTACGRASGESKVRKAAHADGMWYPGKADELSRLVDGYLNNAEKQNVSGKVMGLIVPHAGYRYCGHVAAQAYKQIMGMKFETVVIIGTSHNYRFSGASVYPEGVYRNPLGDVEIDEKIARSLTAQNDSIGFWEKAHIPEHSLENQIPFLQRTLSDFKIVPVLMGNTKVEDRKMLTDALVKVLNGKNVLLIASTDMSHYLEYDEAVKADKFTISTLEKNDTDMAESQLNSYMKKEINELHCMMCARESVFVVMDTAKRLGADSIKILKYANSGDIPDGNKDRVVGYMAAMMFKSGKDENVNSSKPLDYPLNEEQKEYLLKLVRDRIETYVKTGKKKDYKTDDKRLKVKQGAFVTLKKNKVLRGCIGYIEPLEPLVDTVADMALAAATQDPRFPPVSENELDDIHIEISVLSIPRKTPNADEIEMGKHGVIVQKGFKKGVFLPQVANETGWDKKTFLEHLCWSKAGLSKDAWKEKDTDLYTFTAQLFEE